MKPFGYARHQAEKNPRHWTVSGVEGDLVLNPQYLSAMADIRPGGRIVVLFQFDRGKPFTPCSPVRPNPIGLSVLPFGHRGDFPAKPARRPARRGKSPA